MSVRITILAAFAALTPSATAQTWAEVSPVLRPSAREGHAMTWDANRQLGVMFGGYEWVADAHYDETWEYDGATWTRRRTANAPSPRRLAGMCFDERRGVVVLFGGLRASSFSGNPQYFGDTWEYDGVDWTRITPAGAVPGARFGELAYDSARGKVVLFGGSGPGGLLRDTWEYDGTGWTPVSTPTTPPERYGYKLAYDRGRSRLVAQPSYLFGSTGVLETWEYDGVDWQRAGYVSPPPSYPELQIAYDPFRGVVLLVGAGYVGPTETWEYDGADWRQLPATLPVVGLTGHELVCDERRGALVVFGGEHDNGAFIVSSDRTFEFATRASFTAVGAGCAPSGPAPALLAVGGSVPQSGSTWQAEVAPLSAGSLPLVALGFSDTTWSGQALPLPLDFLGLTGCQLRTSVDAVVALTEQGGAAAWSVAVPAAPALHGVTFFAQALVADAAFQAQGVTNAARLTVGL